MNNCSFLIRLTKDPELVMTNNDTKICKFSGAFGEKYNGEEHTSFFNFVAFGKTGEAIATYVTKGQRLLVQSKARQNSWESEGKKMYSIDFIVQSFSFIEKKDSLKEENWQRDVPDAKKNDEKYISQEIQNAFSDEEIP